MPEIKYIWVSDESTWARASVIWVLHWIVFEYCTELRFKTMHTLQCILWACENCSELHSDTPHNFHCILLYLNRRTHYYTDWSPEVHSLNQWKNHIKEFTCFCMWNCLERYWSKFLLQLMTTLYLAYTFFRRTLDKWHKKLTIYVLKM